MNHLPAITTSSAAVTGCCSHLVELLPKLLAELLHGIFGALHLLQLGGLAGEPRFW